MTTQELDRLRALCEAATPGPWTQWAEHAQVFAGPVTKNMPFTISGTTCKIAECELNYDFDVDEPEGEDNGLFDGDANAAFIAAARTALPALLAEINRLRAELHKDNGDGGVSALMALDDYFHENGNRLARVKIRAAAHHIGLCMDDGGSDAIVPLGEFDQCPLCGDWGNK